MEKIKKYLVLFSCLAIVLSACQPPQKNITSRLQEPERIEIYELLRNTLKIHELLYDGKYKRAQKKAEKQLAYAGRIVHPDHMLYILSQKNLLNAQVLNKDWENAEENSRDILNKLKTRPVTNYSHIGTVYTALAFSYHIYQNYEKAEENYQSALKFYDPFKKSDQRRRSNALIGLAMVHQTNGKEGKASSLIQEAEESIRLYNPEKYDSIGDILFFKAQILNHQGNRNEAISVYQEAISNYQREEDPDELRQAAALYLIADIYITEERPDKAEPLLTKTKSIFKEKLGRRHKLTKKVNELLSAIESDMVSEYNAKNSREPTDLFTKDTMEVPAKIVY